MCVPPAEEREACGISLLNRRKRKGYVPGAHKKLRHPRRMVKKCRRRRKIFVWTSREISSFTFCVRPASPSSRLPPLPSYERRGPSGAASFSALKPFFLSFSRKTRDAAAEISSFLYRQKRISLLHEGLWELPLCTPNRAGRLLECALHHVHPLRLRFSLFGHPAPAAFFGSLTLFSLIYFYI